MGKITYAQPPLIEVSFGLFFAPLPNFRTSHFGAFWDRIRADFPTTEDKPPVTIVQQQIFSPTEWFPLPRVWFEHKDHEQLLQMQSDRFYFNWRKQENGIYPRYEALEPLYFGYLETLQAFVQEEALGPLQISGVELVYVNRIEPGEGFTGVSDIASVFPDLAWSSGRRTPAPQGVAWHGLFELEGVRLDADIKTARKSPEDTSRFLQFELRATSPGPFADMDAIGSWYRKANVTIVSAFSDLTSADIQNVKWQRVQG